MSFSDARTKCFFHEIRAAYTVSARRLTSGAHRPRGPECPPSSAVACPWSILPTRSSRDKVAERSTLADGQRGLQYGVGYEFQLIDDERHADAKTPLNGLPSREQPPGWLNLYPICSTVISCRRPRHDLALAVWISITPTCIVVFGSTLACERNLRFRVRIRPGDADWQHRSGVLLLVPKEHVQRLEEKRLDSAAGSF